MRANVSTRRGRDGWTPCIFSGLGWTEKTRCYDESLNMHVLVIPKAKYSNWKREWMRCSGYLWLLCTVTLASLCWDKAMSVEACRLGECVLSWDTWRMVLSEVPLQKMHVGYCCICGGNSSWVFFCVDLCDFCTFMMLVETLLHIAALMWFLHEIVNAVLTVWCDWHWKIAIRWFVNILVTSFSLPCSSLWTVLFF